MCVCVCTMLTAPSPSMKHVIHVRGNDSFLLVCRYTVPLSKSKETPDDIQVSCTYLYVCNINCHLSTQIMLLSQERIH